MRSLAEVGVVDVRVYAGGTQEWEARGGRLVAGCDAG